MDGGWRNHLPYFSQQLVSYYGVHVCVYVSIGSAHTPSGPRFFLLVASWTLQFASAIAWDETERAPLGSGRPSLGCRCFRRDNLQHNYKQLASISICTCENVLTIIIRYSLLYYSHKNYFVYKIYVFTWFITTTNFCTTRYTLL